jgi:putative intracellular protease/amidase
MTTTVHLAIYDTAADWEYGYAIAHINSDDFQREPGRYSLATVGLTREPITTVGGLRIVPDLGLDDLEPTDSAMLILPGAGLWLTDPGRLAPFAHTARDFVEANVPVAAICGATAGLARAGLLDDRAHTSNAAEFLNSIGYGGSDHYRNEPAVSDRGVITATAVAPVDFAREIFTSLELYEPSVLDAWYRLYGKQDPSGYYDLMAPAGA